MDNMNTGVLDFSKVEVLVLDEATACIDMGFWRMSARSSSALPGNRQTLLFSPRPVDVVSWPSR